MFYEIDHNSARRATSAAKKAVIAVLAASILAIGLLMVERIRFTHAYEEVTRTARYASELNGQILLNDEQLTMSARMGAATGKIE